MIEEPTETGVEDTRAAPVALLIQPPFYRLFNDRFSLDRYPLSLGYLSATIRQKTQWEVRALVADFVPGGERISDLQMYGQGFIEYKKNLGDPNAPVWQALEDHVRHIDPDVVGILTLSPTYGSAQQTARLVKRCRPSTLVMVGGPYPTVAGERILDEEETIDLVVQGEGEATVVDVLNAVSNGASLEHIPGLISRKESRPVVGPPRAPIADLDSLPFPHLYVREALIDYDRYPLSAFGTILSSRGCLFSCFFCASKTMWGRQVRTRSVENVIDELRSLHRFGVKTVHFIDDNLRPSREEIRELCDRIHDACPELKWSCYLHVNLIDEPTVESMRRAGCQSIMLGIESGNDEMLRRMGKQIVVSEGFAAAEIIRRHGVVPYAFFLVGAPDETEETLMDTYRAMKRFRGGLVLSVFTPYPGTKAYETCIKEGIIGPEFEISNYNHQSPMNYFCPGIPKERLTILVDELFHYVEQHNAQLSLRNDIAGWISPDIFSRVHRYGLVKSLRHLTDILGQTIR